MPAFLLPWIPAKLRKNFFRLPVRWLHSLLQLLSLLFRDALLRILRNAARLAMGEDRETR